MHRKREAFTGTRRSTQAVRAGQHRTELAEHSEALFLTSSFVFDSAEEAARTFAGERDGYVYSRYTNPTVAMFEERLAAMEGAEAAVATASGMAAELSLCMSVLQSGSRLVASDSLFGTSLGLFNKVMTRFAVQVDIVPFREQARWRQALSSPADMVFVESPSNPLGYMIDIPWLAAQAHAAGALLVVDNAFATPILQNPLALGADALVHTATKFLDGHGRCVGGAVVASRQLCAQVHDFLRTAGPSMSPFNAWVFLKGLETLELRMQRSCATALQLAEWLETQPGVAQVYYPGLPAHPSYPLAREHMRGFGAVVSVAVRGGQAEAWKFIDNTRLFSLTPNLGDNKSTIVHPASTTHARLSPQAREQAGIADNVVRLAIGLEHPADLKEDLQRGLGNR